jgi:hypothetical protein
VGDDLGDLLGLQDFDSEPFDLSPKAAGQILAADALRKAGDVVEVHRRSSLTTDCRPLDDERIDAFSCCVECRGQAGRSTADYDQVVVVALGCGLEAQFLGQLGVGRIREDRAVIECDRWDATLAGVRLDDETLALLVLFDVYPLVGNLVFSEKLLAAVTVRAPDGAVDGDS